MGNSSICKDSRLENMSDPISYCFFSCKIVYITGDNKDPSVATYA